MESRPSNTLYDSRHAEILKLEKQYAKAIADGEVFEVVKIIREKINQIKAELAIHKHDEVKL
jgi:flagellar biosynthesis regulator FlbT